MLNEKDLALLEQVENMIEDNHVQSAKDMLQSLVLQYPNDGRVLYNYGKIAMLIKDFASAEEAFEQAIAQQYENAHLLLLSGALKDAKDDNKAARSYYEKACELADDATEKWATNQKLALFYIENKMFAKAKKIAEKMIHDYPDNYEGYHLNYLYLAGKKMWEEARLYLNEVPDIFTLTPQYLRDIMEWYTSQGKTKEFLSIVESDDNYMKVIPNEVLKLKYRYLYEQNDVGYVDVLKELITNYSDVDAMITLMTLFFANQQYDKSSKIGAELLKNTELTDPQMYLVLFYQIYSFYYLSNKNPTEEVAEWIEQAGQKCIEIAARIGNESVFQEVRTAISELFSEMNQKESE